MKGSRRIARAGSAPRREYSGEKEGGKLWHYLATLLLWLATTCCAAAQGFAGLGGAGEGFAEVVPGYRFSFPADHGAHEDYRIEWWYVTANLKGSDAQDYGVQWTLFRQTMRVESGTGWDSGQLWMGHAGLTTVDRHFVAEKFARGGIGQAGVLADPIEVWIDDWSMEGSADDLSLSATGDGFAYHLELLSDASLVFHGDAGLSVKSEAGQASYYYSQPFFSVTGRILVEGAEVAVSGQAWLDREWSTQPLAPDQAGWDWFSLHLDGGVKVMLFRLRHEDGRDYYSGTWIEEDGRSEALPNGSITLAPLDVHGSEDVKPPVQWQLEVPSKDLRLEVKAINQDAYMTTLFPYWEGPVRVTGSHSGVGYLEMTGYGGGLP